MAVEDQTLPDSLLRLPSFVMFQLLRETRRLTAQLGDGGLRLPHLEILCCLAETGPLAQKDISARLRIDPSDLVALLDDLETAGLANRQRDTVDRRRYLVSLTDKGDTVREARLATSRRLDEALFAPLRAEERETLHRLLLRTYAHHDPDRLPAEYR
ncbi:MAG TPA: MarR family transcriptional regulator [Pseudonocardiaceae bacterium]|jgi:DNA-binding MarR family transcriptional regulator|nr:MarR family transcriptional regulator [Pseudonocardiaceae bacterium]